MKISKYLERGKDEAAALAVKGNRNIEMEVYIP